MPRYEPLPGNTQNQDQLLVLTDDKGRITYASSAFCRLCGFDEDSLKAEGFSQLRHPNMPKGPLNDLWETLGRNDSRMGMIRNRNARGNDLWLDAFVTPISDEHGSLAKRTQQSTDEIREMITALQEGSARVVESMEKGKHQSAASVEQVSVSAEALQAIVTGINESDGLNQQIAAATEQQSQTVSQLSQEIHTIHQLASQTCHQLADTVNAGESVGHHVFRQKFLIKHLMPAGASNAQRVSLKEKVS